MEGLQLKDEKSRMISTADVTDAFSISMKCFFTSQAM